MWRATPTAMPESLFLERRPMGAISMKKIFVTTPATAPQAGRRSVQKGAMTVWCMTCGHTLPSLKRILQHRTALGDCTRLSPPCWTANPLAWIHHLSAGHLPVGEAGAMKGSPTRWRANTSLAKERDELERSTEGQIVGETKGTRGRGRWVWVCMYALGKSGTCG